MPRDAYGVTWADGVNDATINLHLAFNAGTGGKFNLHEASGFEGAFVHLQRAIDLIWNTPAHPNFFIWNEWSELLIRTWIETLFGVGDLKPETPENPVTGPSSSWKTTALGCYINCWWLADPVNTKVIPSSTTVGGLRERIWKDVLKFYRGANVGFGNVVNHPHPKIQTIRNDDSSGIHGVAVEKGDVDAAIDKIKGRHAPNVLVPIDEGTGAQPAIVETCVNLSTGCNRFQLIMLANAGDPYDEHGKLSEPEAGWNSVSVDTVTWKTKRGGIGIHLDGHKSPNVMAGYRKYPGMIAQEDLDMAAKQYGENSPRYWQERRGWWAPEGITKTVLTPTIISKFKVSLPKEQVIWVRPPTLIAAADPAYEGSDRKPIGLGGVGLIDEIDMEGKSFRHTVLCFMEYILLKLDVTSQEPIHYQLARQYREQCKGWGVEPYYFGLDTTGEGGGVASILKREWSDEFLEVEFGGRASDMPVSDINPRKRFNEYYDMVTELWYDVRQSAERNQLRGMPMEMAREFCSRNYDMAGPRIWVESKKIMKARTGKSPDLGDMGAIMNRVALVRGLLSSNSLFAPDVRSGSDTWNETAKKMVPLSRYAKVA